MSLALGQITMGVYGNDKYRSLPFLGDPERRAINGVCTNRHLNAQNPVTFFTTSVRKITFWLLKYETFLKFQWSKPITYVTSQFLGSFRCFTFAIEI